MASILSACSSDSSCVPRDSQVSMDNRYSPPTLVIDSNDESHLAWIEFWNDHLMHSWQ